MSKRPLSTATRKAKGIAQKGSRGSPAFYACQARYWQKSDSDECTLISFDFGLNRCQNFPSKWRDTISSLGPNQGYSCILYTYVKTPISVHCILGLDPNLKWYLSIWTGNFGTGSTQNQRRSGCTRQNHFSASILLDKRRRPGSLAAQFSRGSAGGQTLPLTARIEDEKVVTAVPAPAMGSGFGTSTSVAQSENPELTGLHSLNPDDDYGLLDHDDGADTAPWTELTRIVSVW
ncbi:hypothetical protein B0H14DRAFT_2561865 [Mycena olivaceomarginata]|nr:hypothetical protein B0H14DRAFT_2561865 [Mycena olivaceomarginata]